MTDARDKLYAMQACAPALRWVGDRTIEQAWHECERGEWMCWLLARIAPRDPRSRLAAADMAERVWNLIPDEPTRLATAWAIDAARRGDADEMDAASCTAISATAANAATAYAATAATAYATYAAYNAARSAADAAAAAAADAAANAYDVADAYDAYDAESAAQAAILREYFSAREVGELFRQALV